MSTNSLRWKFDVSAFRLIGRELITDRVTALFELVKNCYDANATYSEITFNNIANDNQAERCITIKDDGFGMSLEDIQNKWMVIGTPSKRISQFTPEPFHRRCVGEKGIGRFAVDKLGDQVYIKTKKQGDNNWIEISINWSDYESAESSGKILYFTDIDNEYRLIPCEDIQEHGTTITIRSIREKWNKNDIKRFCQESSRIVSPYAKLKMPFDIIVNSTDYGINNRTSFGFNPDDINLATLSGQITFGTDYQEYFIFDETTLSLQKARGELLSFGGIEMSLFFFDGKARKKYNELYKSNPIDGIKIYRDELITTPFAEAEDNIGKQRDILGIDKARWQDVFDKVSTREIIGYISITKERNPNIIDSTNRQDFVDNQEYRDLKDFILRQLDAIYNYKQFIRKASKGKVVRQLLNVQGSIGEFAKSIEDIIITNPEIEPKLSPLITQATRLEKSVGSALKIQEEIEREHIRKENMYLSIMSLQEYAIQVTHAVRTSLSRIQTNAQYFAEFFPNPEEDDLFLTYAKEIYEEMKVLDIVIDSMLSYSSSTLSFEELDTKETIEQIINGYKRRFKDEHIDINLSLLDNLHIFCNKAFIKEIIQNLINNSIKALSHLSNKYIKISSFIENDSLVILVSDNGIGIPSSLREWVFGLYNTTTEKEGGAGVGLYVVRSRVKALRGKVFITDSEFGSEGTTIRIELPFKPKKNE